MIMEQLSFLYYNNKIMIDIHLKGGTTQVKDMDLQEKVIEIFEEVLGTDEIAEDLDLDMFENELLDSLAIIEVLLGIEEKLGLSLQPTDLERKDMATVNNLVAFLEPRLK